MEDLNAASLDDVREWFKTYYGAANATLVIAGDIDARKVRDKVDRFFGDIPAGPPITKQPAKLPHNNCRPRPNNGSRTAFTFWRFTPSLRTKL